MKQPDAVITIPMKTWWELWKAIPPVLRWVDMSGANAESPVLLVAPLQIGTTERALIGFRYVEDSTVGEDTGAEKPRS